MELDFLNNLCNNIKENKIVKSFLNELENALEKNKNETENNNKEIKQDEKLNEYRKEGHLYIVEEDINDRIFLWDITEKPQYTFEEVDFPKELLNEAKEGTVFQYKDGKYNLYSRDGFERIYK